MYAYFVYQPGKAIPSLPREIKVAQTVRSLNITDPWNIIGFSF